MTNGKKILTTGKAFILFFIQYPSIILPLGTFQDEKNDLPSEMGSPHSMPIVTIYNTCLAYYIICPNKFFIYQWIEQGDSKI